MSFLSKIIIYGFLLIGFCQFTGAQTTKQIEVDGNEPYVDHVSLMEGSTDMDLLVKFMFDEPNNSLTVSLISYRKLFVFQDNTRYSRAVWCFKLRPNKLSYVVESDEQARYKLTKALRKSIKPRRKHIFKRWIEYEGLQPQPTDYKMVNDYIEQTFDILHKEAPAICVPVLSVYLQSRMWHPCTFRGRYALLRCLSTDGSVLLSTPSSRRVTGMWR